MNSFPILFDWQLKEGWNLLLLIHKDIQCKLFVYMWNGSKTNIALKSATVLSSLSLMTSCIEIVFMSLLCSLIPTLSISIHENDVSISMVALCVTSQLHTAHCFNPELSPVLYLDMFSTCVDFFWVLGFPSTTRRKARRWTDYANLHINVVEAAIKWTLSLSS